MTPAVDRASERATDAAPKRARAGTEKAAGKVVLGLSGAALVVAVWYVIAVTEVVGAGQVPRPDVVAGAMGERFTEADLLFDLRVSVTRVMIGVSPWAVSPRSRSAFCSRGTRRLERCSNRW